MTRTIEKITKYFQYVFAVCVSVINFTLIFDNVVWGDEAFSGNTVSNTSYYGIFQRIFFWDCHPPLYYYYLRVVSDLLGHVTWVYHLASFIPFMGGIVLAVTVWKKRLDNIAPLFFIAISGLSAVCAEYNNEIRMYALVFFWLTVCCLFSFDILTNTNWKGFIGLTLFGVAAAYTHYYGLVTSGILLFVTSVFFFIKNRKKTWAYGLVSIVVYLLLYAPWLSVLFRQMKVISNTWWMEKPESLDNILNFIFGGGRVYKVLIVLYIVCFIIVMAVDFGFARIEKSSKSEYKIIFSKPKFMPSIKLQSMMCMLLAMILVIGFSYVISYLYRPILTSRYMYPVIPLMLTSLMIGVCRVLEIAKEWKIYKGILLSFGILFAVITVLGLLDFKYFRTVSRVQDARTRELLETVGEPNEDTVFTSLSVQHLSWTVLYYYYPNNEIKEGLPTEVSNDVNEIWSFYNTDFGEDTINEMTERGYNCDVYPDQMIAKYNCYLYHFYKG